MKDYIKELEARNELLSNRLEAAETLAYDESPERSLELLIKSHLDSHTKGNPYDNNPYSPVEMPTIHFKPGAFIDVDLVAHIVAHKLFKNCIFLYTGDHHKIEKMKSQFSHLNENIKYLSSISLGDHRFMKTGIYPIDGIFVMGNIDIDYYYTLIHSLAKIKGPIIFTGIFYATR